PWEIGGSEEGPVPAGPEGEVSGPAAEESAEEAGPEDAGARWEIGGSEEGPVPAEPGGEVSGPAAVEAAEEAGPEDAGASWEIGGSDRAAGETASGSGAAPEGAVSEEMDEGVPESGRGEGVEVPDGTGSPPAPRPEPERDEAGEEPEEDAERIAELLEAEGVSRYVARAEEDPAKTQRISRYALGLEPGEGADAVDAWVYELVDRFNRRHRVVYRQLRIEIGAGIRNYVRTCLRKLGDRGRVFGDLLPDDTGAFPREALARKLARSPLGPSADALEPLIETELSLVRDLLPPARMREIDEALAAADDA
ncbi:MAG: hypothetical protein D6718_04385, partial [Acidobacteria bacterium]